MEIIFKFDDNKPEFYENREAYKLYAMQNAEQLGFCIEKVFEKLREYEKNRPDMGEFVDLLRADFVEILDNSNIDLGRLGY